MNHFILSAEAVSSVRDINTGVAKERVFDHATSELLSALRVTAASAPKGSQIAVTVRALPAPAGLPDPFEGIS